jgi:hypothetical protein
MTRPLVLRGIGPFVREWAHCLVPCATHRRNVNVGSNLLNGSVPEGLSALSQLAYVTTGKMHRHHVSLRAGSPVARHEMQVTR